MKKVPFFAPKVSATEVLKRRPDKDFVRASTATVDLLTHPRVRVSRPKPRPRPAPAPAPEKIPEVVLTQPAIFIVQEFRLVTVGGDIGIMPDPVGSVMVLPGSEKKTYLRKKIVKRVEGSTTSSVVESMDRTAANSISDSVRNSASSNRSQDTFDYSMEASFEGEVSWGLGSGSMEASAQAQTSSTAVHDSYKQAVDSSLDRQVAESQSFHSQQEVTVSSNSSTESTEESVEEFKLVNTSAKAQNFLFCKLAQERITALCLVDARLQLYDARQKQYLDFPLSQLDVVLERAVVAEHRPQVRAAILKNLATVYDHEDEPRTFVESIDRGGVDALRVVRDLRTVIKLARGDDSAKHITVPGIAIQHEVRLLPTGQLGVVRGVAA